MNNVIKKVLIIFISFFVGFCIFMGGAYDGYHKGTNDGVDTFFDWCYNEGGRMPDGDGHTVFCRPVNDDGAYQRRENNHP